MANWLCSREDIKRAAAINGTAPNVRLDQVIEGVARDIEDTWTLRFFIPRIETRLYPWPPPVGLPLPLGRRTPQWLSSRTPLWVDQDLLAVTTLQTQAQDTSPTTIAATDYFLEPTNRPRYNRIEIDRSSTALFQSGSGTSQRAISVLGTWGWSQNTRSVGTVSSGLDASATATSFVCSDASLIDVGDTLLIESEQIFVSERANAANGSDLLDGALTADISEVSITVDNGALYNPREVIQVDSEKMFIESISGNVLTVVRAWDGSFLAAHNDNTAVHVFRTLTIERGINGTTAATHADATSISKYEPEFNVKEWAIAESVARYFQGVSGWGREVGAGEGAREFKASDLTAMRERNIDYYRRPIGALVL